MSASQPAPGEKSLAKLISSLKTALHPSTFVFLTLSSPPPATLDSFMTFREAEGLTVITTQESAAAHNLEYTFPSRMITLNVHSSLEAVGFIAAVSAKLAEKEIGCNPVSGFYHDHCFVPEGKAGAALEALEELVRGAKGE